MLHTRPVSRLLLALLVFFSVTPRAHAITDEEIFRQLRFNFITPGGRALGMGGSFIALADDATAAQANPAGLIQLAAPEFFVEERFIGSDTATESDLVLAGAAARTYDIENERRAITTPTFFSYVIPWQKLALGLSRQELLNTRINVDTSFNFEPVLGNTISWTGDGDAAVQVTNWNVALAWKPTKIISFGGTATLSQFHVDSAVFNTILDETGFAICAGVAGGGGPIDCDLNNDLVNDPPGTVPALQVPHHWYSTSTDDDDTDISFSAGILFTPSEKFSAGLVYRAGADYTFDEEVTDGISGLSVFGAGLGNPNAVNRQTMNLPSSYGLGLKWHPQPSWTFLLDAVRISYSDLLDGLQTQVGILTNVRRLSVPTVTFDVDDVTEIHIGGEYLFSEAKFPWALRVGAYSDPDNVIAEQSGNFGDALQGRDDEIHYTVGAGIVVQQKFQVDFALSFSGIGNEGVASFIYRF